MEHRLVSLIASATEIACALGFEGRLVGRSHECDFPESVKKLPVCTAPLLDPAKRSVEIDREVKALLAVNQTVGALGVYRVDADLLRSLRPTHVLTQVLCDVCAVSVKDVERALGSWTGGRPRVISLAASDLRGVFDDCCRVAEALGEPERGQRLVESLRRRMEDVRVRAQAVDRRPRVAMIEWIEPLMAAGNWTPELVEIAGGANLFGEAGKHSPGLSWEDFVAADPDAIVVTPCGFDLDRTRAEMPALVNRPGWKELRAVVEKRVFLADGNQFFNRPGPRLVESLEILAEVLHPLSFEFGHQGTGWSRM